MLSFTFQTIKNHFQVFFDSFAHLICQLALVQYQAMSALESLRETPVVNKETRNELYQRLSTPKQRVIVSPSLFDEDNLCRLSVSAKKSATSENKVRPRSTNCRSYQYGRNVQSRTASVAKFIGTCPGKSRLVRIQLLRKAELIETNVVDDVVYHIRKDFDLYSQRCDTVQDEASLLSSESTGKSFSDNFVIVGLLKTYKYSYLKLLIFSKI